MRINLLEYPDNDSWRGVYKRALVTMGKDTNNTPTSEWCEKILKAKHSPIRYIRFSFYLECPYWVSVHLCRHVHAQPYVKSQRNDRQDSYDRNSARQDEEVCMIWDMNAEELITICNKRLCNQTATETRYVVQQMCDQVIDKCPEFKGVLVPICEREKICYEMKPCGRKQTEYSLNNVIESISNHVYQEGYNKGLSERGNV